MPCRPQSIDSAVARMQGNATLIATVIGETDSAGGDAANLRLSERRANTVPTAVWHTGTIPA